VAIPEEGENAVEGDENILPMSEVTKTVDTYLDICGAEFCGIIRK
jgi:hypothetical protein